MPDSLRTEVAMSSDVFDGRKKDVRPLPVWTPAGFVGIGVGVLAFAVLVAAAASR